MVHAWNNKGIVLNDLGRQKEALESFEEAIRLNLEDALGWSNLGIALEKLGKPKEAKECAEKAEFLKNNLPARM